MVPAKRVYYFTPPKFALKNLKSGHLKVSRFSKCNDPFELAAFSHRNKKLRQAFKSWLEGMDKRYGLLCFSRSWRNPVMWSHYALNHTGLCVGFDVDPSLVQDVQYVSERLHPNLAPENLRDYIGEAQMLELSATKFIGWSYEEEVRMYVKFPDETPPGKIDFIDFSDTFKLKQVIVGPRCEITRRELTDAVTADNVGVFKSRLAYQRFEVVRQKDKTRW